jgi:Zn-dependent M28 family amino/carboxypeptidase
VVQAVVLTARAKALAHMEGLLFAMAHKERKLFVGQRFSAGRTDTGRAIMARMLPLMAGGRREDMKTRRFATVCLLSGLLSVPIVQAQRGSPKEIQPALGGITGAGLLQHIKVLASDEFEGRGPGSKGEELTVKYLTEQFKAFGLKPGNPNGSYIQNVPLAGLTSKGSGTMSVGGKPMPMRIFDDAVLVSRRFVPEIKVADSDVVFVGYGVVAPEYGWDDYKGVDVKGKTIVMLINDPPVPDTKAPKTLDDRIFKGRAMTYYGRWTYKYEIATEKGAAAALIVHETGPAGYPYEVVVGSWGTENFDIQSPDKSMGRVPVEGWITSEYAKALFAAAGQNFDTLKQQAVTRNFRPVALGAKANLEIRNTLRTIQSRNVVAKFEGSDPARRNELVVYSAHWDHLGRDTTRKGDQIFNGAADNASGTAALLEIARAYAKVSPAPRRSILFLAVTAEESGLLGAKYYGNNPLYPLERTLANINMDGLNQWGRTSDIISVGYGNSTLDDVLTEVAAANGRTVKPDAEPEKGFFYRSDHFEFAKQGVPALDPDSGTEYIGKPAGYGQQKRDEYTARDYHKVSDEVKPDWDLSGAVDDVRLFLEVGYRVSQTDRYPEWKPGAEFKAKREAMLKKK